MSASARAEPHSKVVRHCPLVGYDIHLSHHPRYDPQFSSIMPPLPSALDDETKSLIASLERRQKDLADFQIPRLRACTGPLTLQQQYAAELRDDLDLFGRQLEVCCADHVEEWRPRPISVEPGRCSRGPEDGTWEEGTQAGCG